MHGKTADTADTVGALICVDASQDRRVARSDDPTSFTVQRPRNNHGLLAAGREHGSGPSPSMPNYLALAGGSTFGVTDDAPPAAHRVPVPCVFDLAVGAGRTARTYAEATPASCAQQSQGRYAVKHNPWAYFSDDTSRRACDADAWVSGWVSRVLQGPDWRTGRLAVVVTFDEAEAGGDNTVLTVVVAPGLHGVVADGALTHASWTRWMSDLAGSPAPGDARAARSLGAAFGL